GAAQPFVDAKAAVQARVVDIAFPAHRGARLFKVHPHDHQQVVFKGVGRGFQAVCVFDSLGMIVDRTGAYYHHQPVVAAVQHVGNAGAGVLDQRLRGLRNRQFVLQQGGRNQRAYRADAHVVDARSVLGGVGGADFAVVAGVIDAGHGNLGMAEFKAAALSHPGAPTLRGYGQRRASRAMCTASPASTVPISQRWMASHNGRAPRKPAMVPAARTIMALTARLISTCVMPSVNDCSRMLPWPGWMNCGSKDKYRMAILGLSKLVTSPMANSCRELLCGSCRTWKGDRPPGRNVCHAR